MARGPHGDFKKRMLRTTTGSAEHLHAEHRLGVEMWIAAARLLDQQQ
jgi:hypothetical protein